MRISRNHREEIVLSTFTEKKKKKVRPQNKITLTLSELLRPAVKRLFYKKHKDNLLRPINRMYSMLIYIRPPTKP